MDSLKNILTIENIKNLNNDNCHDISDKIRDFLISNVMKNGGHLASNLGVVELTLALHKVFDFPKDKIIFDVGHQSYVHKLLSGRIDGFKSLRTMGGMSGFPKRAESEYDCFDTGHSSTSISAALGIAKARDTVGDDFNVIAFIGDGALGGGMAFEALNNAGAGETKVIIILNDNEMSINKNVGGLSSHLSMLRLSKKYISVKGKVNRFFSKFGKPGVALSKFIKKTKKAIKSATLEDTFFEGLGLAYIGLIDGHNIDDLCVALEKAKTTHGPVLIHVATKKGYGYLPAEENPDVYHGVSANFSPDKKNTSKSYTSLFGDYIIKKAEDNDKLVVITAAMASGCGLNKFSNIFPERFYDVGIAEEHAVTFAAGLSCGGIIPVFSVYSTFLQRGYDQLLHDVCIQNLHVIFSIDRAGVVGEDGETHQGVFDLSYLSHMPNMTVLAPSCEKEFIQMMDYAIDKCKGPVAVRFPKDICVERDCADFNIGKPETVCECGNDIVIFSFGRMLERSYDVYSSLKNDGFNVKLINVGTVKPISACYINEILDGASLAVTLEDNVVSGGAGEYLCNCSERKFHSLFTHFGFPDRFIEHGKQSDLMDLYGLNTNEIIQMIKKEMNIRYE